MGDAYEYGEEDYGAYHLAAVMVADECRKVDMGSLMSLDCR